MTGHMHFVFSLYAEYVGFRLSLVDFLDGEEGLVDLFHALIQALLNKGSSHDTSRDYMQHVLGELKSIGMDELQARACACHHFDQIAGVLIETLPNFGNTCYEGNYEYTMRNNFDLHLVIPRSVFHRSAAP